MGRNFLNKLERKLGRYAIRNLMSIIVFVTLGVWLLDTVIYTRSGVSIMYYLFFSRDLILQGQVWRIVTFIFVPDSTNLFRLFISLYFYWLIGNGLANAWGTFKFNVFYFTGIFCTIISGFITGYTDNGYLNLTVFLAYAILFPDDRVYIFFLFPVKMKVIGIIDGIFLLLSFIFSNWIGRIALIFALLNLILFFWKDVYDAIYYFFRRRKYKRQAKVKPIKINKKQKENQKDYEDDGFFDS